MTRAERWACTEQHATAARQRLPSLLAAHGRIALIDLAAELGAPEPVVRGWIYASVQDGRLQGYIDWKQGVLFSRDADALRLARLCPGCGGQLELVGRGIVRCPYCGAEIFL